ncbi:hypothetical protein Rsub_09513 [Raphidocelis subcapitata]|uniref:GB1/RHD3-type G domain-containing protein n=1 Tax=Raphidocelis subcapitata TaxID=307507 RepID=A0A2V0PGK6_9CHLO|nr:hypothetical protein Rsub_09513 [Raphidocelis subcapitata]|eukprot:GBF97040.1 hypothetical protein Rsub_09513 [Raphidocelis subcapitata]
MAPQGARPAAASGRGALAAARRATRPLLPLLPLLLLLLAAPLRAFAGEPRPYLLVQQVPGHSQLKLADEGVQLLRSFQGPVAPVVVIGPYRSGKSFLLNQLLGVSCGVGFGVGHTRDTQTKGIWLWGEGQEAPEEGGGGNRTVLFVDTEGFESTARSSSYDDRIFAVAAVLSSLLVYNLPETIRETDISKLSFAVDLASGFYDQWKKASEGSTLQPGRMLWVIQRHHAGTVIAVAAVAAVAAVDAIAPAAIADSMVSVDTHVPSCCVGGDGFAVRSASAPQLCGAGSSGALLLQFLAGLSDFDSRS